MKKLLIILITIFLITSCVNNPLIPENPDNPAVPVGDPDPVDPITPPSGNAIKAVLYDGTTMRFWDGATLSDAYSGDIAFSSSRIISIGDVLHEFDSAGNVLNTRWLNISPDLVRTSEYTGVAKSIASRATTFYEDDVYTIEIIEPAEAYALGAQYKYYTRIFENSVEVGHWYLNQWQADEIVVPLSGEIIIVDTLDHFHNLTNGKNVFKVYDGGILIYDNDINTLTVGISDDTGDYAESYTRNYFISGRWQEADGIWYSGTGYEWDNVNGLVEEANALYAFNGPTYPAGYIKQPGGYALLMPCGARMENGEEVLYWLELSYGYFWKLIPSTNVLQKLGRAYFGYGFSSDIAPRVKVIDPILIDDEIWFHEDGYVKIYDIATQAVSIFSGDQELLPW